MTIRTRLTLGLIAIVVILVVPLGLALRSLQQLHRSAVQLRDREFAASLLLGGIHTGLEDLRRAETALLFVHDAKSRDVMSAQIGHLAAMADSLDRYQLDSAAAQVHLLLEEVSALAPVEFDAALGGRATQAESISTTRVLPAIANLARAVAQAEMDLRTRTRRRVAEATIAIRGAERVAALALILALGVAAGIAVWLTRSIAGPVRDLDRGMRAVAGGDFAYPVGTAATRQDELGRLARSFRSMSSQLAELEKLRAEFVSVASHELKTPINVIIGYLQLFDEGLYGELSPKQREVLGVIGTQAQSLSRLTKQLLDVSRFEAGGGKIEPRPMDLRRFLADLEAAFQVLAGQRQIGFRVCCADDAPEQVVWDQDRMNEVMGNLLSNAFKFTPRGGRVDLDVASHEGLVHLEVRDTGAGIPPEQLPHVFEKFYQADNQRSAAHAGAGLGLAIAREIVEAHGGTIEVESTVGVGTAFTITMPVQARGGAPQPELPARPARATTATR